MKYVLFTGILTMSVYLFGCATPETIYRADPVSENPVWYSGLAFQTETKDSVTVSVAFENELEGEMTFYVVVGNEGTHPVLVSPEMMHYNGNYTEVIEATNYETMNESLDTLSDTENVYAVNPESKLVGIDQQVAQANATYVNNTGLNVAAGLMNLIGSVATIGQHKTREDRRREERNSRSVRESQMENNFDYSSQMNTLAGQRAYWANAALRKTTLFENNAVGGKVRFSVTPKLASFKVIVPIGSIEFKFGFNQHPVLPVQ